MNNLIWRKNHQHYKIKIYKSNKKMEKLKIYLAHFQKTKMYRKKMDGEIK